MSADPLPERPFDLFDLPLGSIIHAAREAIVMIDERHDVVALNPAALKLFDCSAAEMLGQPLARLIPERFRAAHDAHVRRFSASRVVEQEMGARREIRALRADGREFPAEIRLSRVDMADSRGPRHYLVALLRDLSVERGLQQELDSLQRRLRAVFELAPIALWIADNDRIVFVNRAAAQLLGGGPAPLGQSIYTLLHRESHGALRRQVARALAGEPELALVHGRLNRPDGEAREVEIVLAALPDHGRTTVQMVVTDVTRRRAEALELQRSQQLLRELSASVVEAREEERRRIARELHDELGQRLTALKMELSSLRAADLTPACAKRLPDMMGMLDETVASLRRISADLRPSMLDDLGLNAAIEWLAAEASRRLGLHIEVRLDEAEAPTDERVGIALYRMVQEALTNVGRHARASAVTIELRHVGGDLLLSIHDDGVGFPARALQRAGSYGLLGMRERAHLLGGRLEIDNPPGGGGRVRVEVPLHRSADGSDAVPPGP